MRCDLQTDELYLVNVILAFHYGTFRKYWEKMHVTVSLFLLFSFPSIWSFHPNPFWLEHAYLFNKLLTKMNNLAEDYWESCSQPKLICTVSVAITTLYRPSFFSFSAQPVASAGVAQEQPGERVQLPQVVGNWLHSLGWRKFYWDHYGKWKWNFVNALQFQHYQKFLLNEFLFICGNYDCTWKFRVYVVIKLLLQICTLFAKVSTSLLIMSEINIYCIYFILLQGWKFYPKKINDILKETKAMLILCCNYCKS